MKILHITNWFPTNQNPTNAIWIKRHIDALDSTTVGEILHFEIIPNRGFKLSTNRDNKLSQTILSLPISSWFIFEIIYSFWLFFQLVVTKKHKNFDIINFHIAYPMLTYWHWMKRFVKKPIVTTEHWSAYHYNFGVEKSLPRIQKIFQQNIPIITVSKALSEDIKRFANSEFPSYVVPNVVNTSIFHAVPTSEREDFLFMVSHWKEPKTPLAAMEAFLKICKNTNTRLIIGGNGPLWTEMKDFAQSSGQIEMLGRLDSKQIAHYMQRCKAFLHPSNYETFSVVCAEAVACGAYVIAPKIGGIPEVVGDNGSLIKNNCVADWNEALQQIPADFKSNYDLRFSAENVASKYDSVFRKIISEFKK